MPHGSLPRSAVWDDAYLPDELPVTHHRRALAVLALLAVVGVVGILALPGSYRHLVSGGRRALGLDPSGPAQSSPSPGHTVPPVESPGAAAPSLPPPPTGTTSQTPAAGPAPAAATPENSKVGPPETKAAPAEASAARSHQRHLQDEQPIIVNRPGSVYLSPSSPGLEPPTGPRPSAAPATDPLQHQFSIPPPAPTEDSPSRDLVPPPEPEREPRPAVNPSSAPAPPTSAPGQPAAPRPKAPADQPLAPSL